MKKFNVTGMSCAACSSRVEKAVSKVEGVQSCSVSLLTNSMGVEGSASEESIIAAVEKAGYGASVAGAEKKQSAETDRLSCHADVYFNGAYDVGLAVSCVFCGQSYRNGTCAAFALRYNNGYQPKIFYKRI